MRASAPDTVALVCTSLPGPDDWSEIGDACAQLARYYAELGCRVTLLHLGDRIYHDELDHWQAHFAGQGLTFAHLPGRIVRGKPHVGRTHTSHVAYEWLAGRDWRLILFPDRLGLGFHCMQAKRHGLAFAATRLAVHVHGSLMHWSQAQEMYPHAVGHWEVAHMEREAIALADTVIIPSTAALGAMNKARQFPRKVVHATPPCQGRADPRAESLRRLVFFGDLHDSHGLGRFIQALERLRERLPRFPGVTLLGRDHTAYKSNSGNIRERLARNFPDQIEHQVPNDRADLLECLRQPGTLACCLGDPSLQRTRIRICAMAGIPLLALDEAENREWLDAAQLVERQPDQIAARIQGLLDGVALPAAPAKDSAENGAWRDLLSPVASSAAPTRPLPSISVCLTHYQRPAFLAQALASLRQQTYPALELILVDDGSADQASLDYLRGLQPEFDDRGWTLLRQENTGPGTARNRAAAAAKGEYLMFMDDDNLALPNELETLARAAAFSDADTYVCGAFRFEGDGPPAPEADWERMLPLGNEPISGLRRCSFGDTNSLLRREWFLQRGGFPEGKARDEDWEFLAELVLSGHRLEVVPDILYWYRETDQARHKQHSRHANDQLLLDIYEQHLPEPLHDLAAAFLALARESGRGALARKARDKQK